MKQGLVEQGMYIEQENGYLGGLIIHMDITYALKLQHRGSGSVPCLSSNKHTQ